MGQSLQQGRDFLESDRADTLPVCIVSQSFARRFWPGQDPLGNRIKQGRLDGPRPWLTVVGIAADTKSIADQRDGEVVGTVCLPLPLALANGFDEMTFVVEAGTNERLRSLELDVRAAVNRADERLAAYQIIALDQAASESWVTERFLFVLVSLFGVLGLLLAAIGLYGLLSLQVARRQRELGIRSALGATAVQLIELVTRQGVFLLGIGFVIGSVATWGTVRIVRNQWSAMPAPNFVLWVLGAAVLCLAAALACWLPARRAGRIDPVIALRAE
jgi:ABC-type antimicrobial peptide transport system permease subunit